MPSEADSKLYQDIKNVTSGAITEDSLLACNRIALANGKNYAKFLDDVKEIILDEQKQLWRLDSAARLAVQTKLTSSQEAADILSVSITSTTARDTGSFISLARNLII